ncbi:hypothetical protein [Clostridium sp.]
MRRIKRNLVIILLVMASLLISACGIRGNSDFARKKYYEGYNSEY